MSLENEYNRVKPEPNWKDKKQFSVADIENMIDVWVENNRGNPNCSLSALEFYTDLEIREMGK